jgi:hypothetical protein
MRPRVRSEIRCHRALEDRITTLHKVRTTETDREGQSVRQLNSHSSCPVAPGARCQQHVASSKTMMVIRRRLRASVHWLAPAIQYSPALPSSSLVLTSSVRLQKFPQAEHARIRRRVTQRGWGFVLHACFKLGEYAHERSTVPLDTGIRGIFIYFEDRINFSTCCPRIPAALQITGCEDAVTWSPQAKEP